MTLPGETLATGAPSACSDCKRKIVLQVCESGAGFYVGAWCNCGPYCRESGYYGTKEEAQEALASGGFGRP